MEAAGKEQEVAKSGEVVAIAVGPILPEKTFRFDTTPDRFSVPEGEAEQPVMADPPVCIDDDASALVCCCSFVCFC